MRWLQRHHFISYTQISFFQHSFSSLSLNIHPTKHHHFLSLLKNFPSSRILTQQIHAHLTTTGSFNQSPNTQITHLFNTLLRRYAIGEYPHEALFLYKQTHKSTTLYSYFNNSFTFSFLIKACANLNYKFMGFSLHTLVIQLGFESHVYVQTALLNMYVNFGWLRNAHKVFDEMPERNLVTWNVMVTGFVKWGEVETALGLFREMPQKNVVSWTGMIDGLTRMKDYVGAFSMFREMMMVGGVMPSEVTLLAVFNAIGEVGGLRNCQAFHGFGEKSGFNVNDSQVANCLIDTYAKCGCIRSALRIFEEMDVFRRNVVSWTSIISGFAMHGMAKEVEEFVQRMESSGVKPNRVTFLSVLNAYSHSGLVDDGIRFFRRMVDHGRVAPDIKHYGSMIDMLGRAGKLIEAEKIALGIPNDVGNAIVWRTLLGACSVHGDIEMAARVTSKIQEMEGGYGGDYVLMSNVLTGQGKFNEAEDVRTLMDERRVQKSPGHSLI